ncbi:hypothetical protein RI367_001831 [Sorochytrium milnesiophthora]
MTTALFPSSSLTSLQAVSSESALLPMTELPTSVAAPTAAMASDSNTSPLLPSPSDPPVIVDASDPADFDVTHPWYSQGLKHRLSTMRKTPDEIQQIRRRGRKASRVAQFYEQQNDQIDTYLEDVNDSNGEDDSDAIEKHDKKVTIAIRGSLAANVLLFSLQATAALLSGSLALFATATDSFMDLLSGVILLLADRAARKQNLLDYPTGKRRFETIGVIVFACLMSTVSVQLMIEGIRALISPQPKQPTIGPMEITFVSLALGSKVILLIYCAALARQGSSSAKTLAQDHQNDLIVNAFGLIMSLLGNHIVWWADPCGALLIAVVILRSWISTAWENVQLVVGRTAPPAFLNRITYLAATHHPAILQVDTCKAYYLGSNLFVEVDIVLPPDMCLKDSHDIGESLQKRLESLKNVERAFVHCDYEFDHKPEHKVN